MRALLLPLAAVASAALVATGPTAGTTAGTTTPSTTAPSAQPEVVRDEDAVDPQAGEDYTKLTTLHLNRHVVATGVTGAGRVVLANYSANYSANDSAKTRYSLLDPTSGERRSLPSPHSDSSLYRIDRDAIWYVRTGYPRQGTTVHRYDRRHHRMRAFTLPGAARGSNDVERVIGIEGRTIWFATGPSDEHGTENVFSVRFGKRRTLSAEGRRLGLPVVADGALAWSRYASDGPSHLVLRDLDSGDVTRAELPNGCIPTPSRVQGNGAEFAVEVSCDSEREHETVVVDRSGTVTTRLRVSTADDGPLGTADRGIFFTWYLYDFATDRLLDISNLRLADGMPLSGPGRHPVQVWPQRRGRALVVRLK